MRKMKMFKCIDCGKEYIREKYYWGKRCGTCFRKRLRERKRKRYWKNPELRRKEEKEYRSKNIEKWRKWDRENYQKNKEKIKNKNKKHNIKLKYGAMEHYCNGEARCMNSNCAVIGGMKDIRALSIDHIGGGGYKHTKIVGRGSSFYKWLKRNNYPEGFQVLCFNCNHIKAYENHEYER